MFLFSRLKLTAKASPQVHFLRVDYATEHTVFLLLRGKPFISKELNERTYQDI